MLLIYLNDIDIINIEIITGMTGGTESPQVVIDGCTGGDGSFYSNTD